MKLWHKILGCLVIVFAAGVVSAETNCVACGSTEIPGNQGNSSLRVLEKVASAAGNCDVTTYCYRFQEINQAAVNKVMDEMKASCPLNSYFKTPTCQPEGYGSAVKSPILHYVADDPEKREKFLTKIWNNYYKDQPDLFGEAINSKNTKGETLLDYIEYRNSTNSSYRNAFKAPLEIIINFLCTHGGKYSTQNKKCPGQ